MPRPSISLLCCLVHKQGHRMDDEKCNLLSRSSPKIDEQEDLMENARCKEHSNSWDGLNRPGGGYILIIIVSHPLIPERGVHPSCHRETTQPQTVQGGTPCGCTATETWSATY